MHTRARSLHWYIVGMLAMSALRCSSPSRDADPGDPQPPGSGGFSDAAADSAGQFGTAGAQVSAAAGKVGISQPAGGEGGGTSGSGPENSRAGQSDGGAADAPPNEGCPGLFCEDFESGSLNPAIWDTRQSGGQTLQVESVLAAHGKYAIQFHGAPNVVSYDFIITKHASMALQGHHYGRAYFYVTPKPPAEHTEFIFAGSTGFPKLKYLELAESGLGWQLTYVQLVAPTGENYKPATGEMPLAKWTCIQWEMNDSPDQIDLQVNGAQNIRFDQITFMGKSSGLVGGFSDFGFGFYIWHPASYAFDVYYDDIVLDTKPIACLPE